MSARDFRPVLLCSAAALFGGVVYLNALHNPFVYDDYRTVLDNGSIRTLTNLRSIFWYDATRPLVNFSYAIDRALWGPGPFGFHLTSVLLHMLNVVLFFLLVRQLIADRQLGRSQPIAARSEVIAFAAAALFAVHPMMTESVGYISGRSEVLCGAFFFVAFMCGRRWMQRGGTSWWLLTAALWGAALLTKETAAMLPAVLFCYDRLMLKGGFTTRLWRLHLPLVSVALAGGIARLAVFAYLEHPGEVTLQWRSILTEAGVIWRYAGLFLAPGGQSIYHEVRPIASVFEPVALVSAIAIVLAVALAWRFRSADSLASFGVIWFFLLLVPSSVIVVLDHGEAMVEHRVYLASCGLFLAAGSFIGWSVAMASHLSRPTRLLVRTAVAVGILLLGARTILRNAVWADPVALWREASDKAPGSFLPRTVLGEMLNEAGRYEEAVEAHRAALRLRPKDPLAHLKLGLSLAALGRIDEATATFEQLRAIDPQSPIVSTGLGAVAMLAGRPDRAREYFNATLEKEPGNIMALQWLAVLEEDTAADPAAALHRCEEIQQLAPGKLSNEDCIRRNRARLAVAAPGPR